MTQVQVHFRLGHVQKIGLFIFLSVLIFVSMTLAHPALSGLGSWVYVGAFFISAISSATVVLPAPGLAAVLSVAPEFDPLWLGVAAGLGGTLGELTAYWLGVHGRQPLAHIRPHRLVDWAEKHFGGPVLFLFAAVPFLPMDVAGLAAGIARYPLPRFLLFVGAGKVIKMVFLTYSAAYSWAWAEPWLERLIM